MNYCLYRFVFGMLCLLHLSISHAQSITSNPAGSVTLVEYYDYECPHCRRIAPILDKLQANYPHVNVVYRVTPLLTPESRLIASFTLAAIPQGKSKALRQRLMALPTAPTMRNAESLAMQLGLNIQQMLRVMHSQKIQQHISNNIHAAAQYAQQGRIALPLFVFRRSQGHGPSIVLRGEQSYALLSAIVQQLRQT